MLHIFNKFIKETILLLNYIFTYYLSNFVVITTLQFIFSITIYNMYHRLNKEIKYKNNKKFQNKNSELIKNLFVSYHNTQIDFIKELFNKQIITQLFDDNTNIYFNDINYTINDSTKDIIYDENTLNNKIIDKLPKLPDSPINQN